MQLNSLLLISSALRTFLDFSHIILLGLVGFSIAALAKDPSLITTTVCLGASALGIAAIQAARSMTTMKSMRSERLKKQLLSRYSSAETEMRIKLAHLAVLTAGSVVVLSLIGSWEALLVTVAGNGLAWLFGKMFVGLTLGATLDETKAIRRKLRPWRTVAIDAIPLITFILGLAVFPSLLGFKAIPIYLILRHTSRHVFQLSVQTGMQRHIQSLS